MHDLIASGLAFFDASAKPLDCFDKEGGNEMRLEPVGFCTLHLFADHTYLACIHRVTRKCPLIQQLPMVPSRAVSTTCCSRALTPAYHRIQLHPITAHVKVCPQR